VLLLPQRRLSNNPSTKQLECWSRNLFLDSLWYSFDATLNLNLLDLNYNKDFSNTFASLPVFVGIQGSNSSWKLLAFHYFW
jgi:hypothetical protein